MSLITTNAFSWNMQGHQIIAQIAYDNLTPSAKALCRRYLGSQAKHSSRRSFINASLWMDQIKLKNNHRFDTLHYIDLPFSEELYKDLPVVKKRNAVWGIEHALSILRDKRKPLKDKKLALRMLIHLVGDIHQPLHAATRVSSEFPEGDLGGNRFILGKNNVGRNLHQYWDRGGGYLNGPKKMYQIKAEKLQRKNSCTALIRPIKSSNQWAEHSHQLAIKSAYMIHAKESPSDLYQQKVQQVAQKQILKAGCELAFLLNQVLGDAGPAF